jgi:hypothetical protein
MFFLYMLTYLIQSAVMVLKRVLFICNLLLLLLFFAPLASALLSTELMDRIVNLLFYSSTGYIIANLLGVACLVFWGLCLQFWGRFDRRIWTLLCLIFLTALFTPFYYLGYIRKK